MKSPKENVRVPHQIPFKSAASVTLDGGGGRREEGRGRGGESVCVCGWVVCGEGGGGREEEVRGRGRDGRGGGGAGNGEEKGVTTTLEPHAASLPVPEHLGNATGHPIPGLGSIGLGHRIEELFAPAL